MPLRYSRQRNKSNYQCLNREPLQGRSIWVNNSSEARDFWSNAAPPRYGNRFKSDRIAGSENFMTRASSFQHLTFLLL